MKIQLETWKIQTLNFSMIEEPRDDNSFELKTGQVFPDDDRMTFVVMFGVELKDRLFDMNLDAAFVFKTEVEISEEFKISNFPKINAPAIAFPYIRAFISNLTLQSGFEPVILPSINFVKLAEED